MTMTMMTILLHYSFRMYGIMDMVIWPRQTDRRMDGQTTHADITRECAIHAIACMARRADKNRPTVTCV